VLWALCFLAPVADELIGKFQYDRYCKESEGMEIYGTIPVGEGLYTEDGKWKLSNGSLPISESNRLQVILDSIVRWEVGKNEEAPAVIPIFYHETKVYEVMTGRLLSVHRIYGTHGGWLSRSFFERGGLFVRPQCLPPLVRESKVNQTILPFNGNVGGVK
jgi:hypothetical protein